MKDYLIVGFGLSGASLAYRLEKMGKSFLVYDDESQKASRVAGGFMNPVVLKRFTLAWKGDEQLEKAQSFYSGLEEHLGKEFLKPLEIYRRFSSVEEQNDWFAAADKPRLKPFLDTAIVRNLNSNIRSEFGFGKVLGASRLNSRQLLESYCTHLQERQLLVQERFRYENLLIGEGGVEYQGLSFKKVIFCEGFGIRKNPYFDYLPVYGNKGEYITIKAPKLELGVGVKSSVFIFPVGEDLYTVGATYNNSDRTAEPTAAAREELLRKLSDFVQTDFELVDQVAGVRPSTADRRPLAGVHPGNSSLFCCNGFGSRGVLVAPWISEQLLNFIERGEKLDPEVDLKRFTKKWYPKN